MNQDEKDFVTSKFDAVATSLKDFKLSNEEKWQSKHTDMLNHLVLVRESFKLLSDNVVKKNLECASRVGQCEMLNKRLDTAEDDIVTVRNNHLVKKVGIIPWLCGTVMTYLIYEIMKLQTAAANPIVTP